MNAAAFSLDVEADSSPTQVSRRRAHIREISRVRHLAIGLTIALAFTSGLGAALAVQLAQTAGSATLHDRTPRSVVTRASSLEVIDGADEKHVAQPTDEKTARGRKSARTRRAPAPATTSNAAPGAAEGSSEVLLPGELLDRAIVSTPAPSEAPPQ